MLKGVAVHSKVFTPSVPVSIKDLQTGRYSASFTSTLAGSYGIGVYRVHTALGSEAVFLKTLEVPLFAGTS
jgi:sporulation-control protein spo0M